MSGRPLYSSRCHHLHQPLRPIPPASQMLVFPQASNTLWPFRSRTREGLVHPAIAATSAQRRCTAAVKVYIVVPHTQDYADDYHDADDDNGSAGSLSMSPSEPDGEIH